MEKELCLGFLNTPPLWTKKQFGIVQFEFPMLDLGQFTPTPIPPDRRLGHKMEAVCGQLLRLSDEYTILGQGLSVQRGRVTIGELDFILKNRYLRTFVHLELTYKFYLINPEISEPIHRLMGPNKRDFFHTKMEKMKQRQFPLVYSQEARALLQDIGVAAEALEHQACFKAQLFAPFGNPLVHIRPLNKNCIVGFWLRFEDFNAVQFKSHQFYIPYKDEWAVAPHTEVPWVSHYIVLMELNIRMLKKNAPMVWMKTSETTMEKFFVVWW